MNFSDLGLDSDIVDRLSQRGILEPTPIQEEAYLKIFDQKHILGLSKTGTGKTLAYLLPLAQRSKALNKSVPQISICILVPTRELATQVARDIVLIEGREDACVVVVGGESEDTQIKASKQASWIVATPGRLLDLLKRNEINLSAIASLVFDEADRLLDMGFVDDMREIRRFVPQKVQLLFFSATLHFGIDEMAYEFGVQSDSLCQIGVSSDELTVEGLDHRVSFVGDDEKFHALVQFIHERPMKTGIVFSNYRDKASHIASRLKGLGCATETLTAQLNQSQRNRIMEQFRDQKIRVLIASDLAARGLDVMHLDFVVNFDLPEDPATYVHRVGRTARAGREGMALSFVGFDDSFRLERLEKYLKCKIDRYQFEVNQLSGPLARFSKIEDTKVVATPRAPKVVSPHSAKNRDPARRVQHQNAGKGFEKPVNKTPVSVVQKSRGGFWERVKLLVLGFFGSSSVEKNLDKASKDRSFEKKKFQHNNKRPQKFDSRKSHSSSQKDTPSSNRGGHGGSRDSGRRTSSSRFGGDRTGSSRTRTPRRRD
jgi:superfamily II DNA/RNA helicase